VAAGALLSAACGSSTSGAEQVPADSSPEEVADAFVSARNDGDVDTQVELATSKHAEFLRAASDLDAARLEDAERQDVTEPEPGLVNGQDYDQAVSVGYRYTAPDGGRLIWRIFLVRADSGQPWSVADEGAP
jgi:hypothetical protein